MSVLNPNRKFANALTLNDPRYLFGRPNSLTFCNTAKWFLALTSVPLASLASEDNKTRRRRSYNSNSIYKEMITQNVTQLVQHLFIGIEEGPEKKKMKMEEETSELTNKSKIRRPHDVVFVHVYRGDLSKTKPSKEDMSALVITGTGEVYGTGRNTLIGWRGKSPMPMKEDGPDVLEEYLKVEALSGLGLRKIVVGLGFGAALTQDNLMYMWGGGPRILSSGDVRIFKEYRPGESCSSCNSRLVDESIGDAYISKCSNRPWCPSHRLITYSELPATEVPVKVFAIFGSALHCLKCGGTCSGKSFTGYTLNYCEPCRIVREVKRDDALLPLLTQPPSLKCSGILDIDCGRIFLCMLSEDNTLTYWGWTNGNRYETKSTIIIPEDVKVQSVSCGKGHIAILSVSGDLYCYGDIDNECFGTTRTLFDLSSTNSQNTLTLRKVDIPSPVVKVCCGDQSTACILNDHSLWFFWNGIGVKSTNEISLDRAGNFADIAAVHFVDEYFLQANRTSLLSVKSGANERDNVVFNISEMKCNEALLNTFELDSFSVAVVERPCLLPPGLTALYGSESLSDITFKLRDGDLPAHRVVLSLTSKYFQNMFMENDGPPTYLDVTEYNPRAYKVLLQYFYQVQPDDLELDDLLDLFSIATDYDEPAIISDVGAKLKAHITVENVQQLLAKGLSSRNQLLVAECKKFVCSPTFRGKVIRAIMQDSNTVLKWLEGGVAVIL